jgi:hypothetical protein
MKIDSSGADSPIATATSTERSLIADRADVSSSTDNSGRWLRNIFIIANVIGWIAIILAVRLLFV